MHGDCSCGVEEHVGEKAGAIGQKALMELVGAGYKECCGNCQGVAGALAYEAAIEAACRFAKGEPESAKAYERKQAVAGEVAGFANDVVDVGPVVVCGCSQDQLEEVVQRCGGVVGAEGCG